MKKLIPFLLIFALLLSLCACGTETTVEQDSARLTMYVGLGNTNSVYYDQLHELVLEKLGVDLQYVYSNTLDTTSAMLTMMRNGDCPADIMVTAMLADAEIQRASLLDMAAYTTLPDLFTSSRVSALSHDGEVYQLPFTTRLIGIEFNRTLLEEMGWDLPSNFDEMVALKEKCEEEGILFAVSGGVATGHGFNYLFHTMGTQYLTSADGAEWYEAFMKGEEDITAFAEEADYFQRYVEAGLFGQFHDQDWHAAAACCKQRALFYYNILNDITSYDGFRYNEDGTLYGAEYVDGEVVAQEDAQGNAVLTESGYTLYDESNPDHAGLQRYTIPGTQELHDEYGSMPWISENGSSNCFTCYDNMYLGLSKKLLEPEEADKLETAKKVLAFIATPEATSLFCNLFPDGYVATKDFAFDDSRIYRDYEDFISRGYLMNWYYNDFDVASIINVGQQVNDYLRGVEGVGLETIISELESRRKDALNGESDVLFQVSEKLDYADCARLQAIAGAMSLQQKLDELGIEGEVNAALLPYVESITQLEPAVSKPVAQQPVYAGSFDSIYCKSLINTGNNAPQLLRLTGSELASLRDTGYEGFAFACAIKGDSTIDGTGEYLLAIAPACMDTELYNTYLAEGRVICDEEGNPVTGSVEEGLLLYAESYPTLSKNLLWE